jgi:hypothetical protein
VQELVDVEKVAGKKRVDEAKAIGADLAQVDKLNADALTKIWKDATGTLKDLSLSLTSGALSGKSAVDQAKAANDNYLKELKLVQGGNLSEATNLATAGNTLVSDYQTLYGNSPTTTKLRTSVLAAVDKVLASRSFAAGTEATPPGWIQVGEQGPEWIYQAGGARVLPAGTLPGVANQAKSANDDQAIHHSALISDFSQALARRSFASGTDATPPGWVQLHKDEWVNQSGGMTVLPKGVSPPGGAGGDLVAEMRALRAEVRAFRQENTRVVAGVGVDTGKRLDAVRDGINKKPLTEPARRRVA